MGSLKLKTRFNYNQFNRLRERIKSIWSTARIYHSSHDDILERMRCDVYETVEYKRLPEASKEYLRGVNDTLFDAHHRMLVFTYLVDGKRVTTDSPEFQALHGGHTDWSTLDFTGAHAYPDDLGKCFNKPHASKADEQAYYAENRQRVEEREAERKAKAQAAYARRKAREQQSA